MNYSRIKDWPGVWIWHWPCGCATIGERGEWVAWCTMCPRQMLLPFDEVPIDQRG